LRASSTLRRPALRTLVIEKRSPGPEAVIKVGGSSVEIGTHYFSKRLELEPISGVRSSKSSAWCHCSSPAISVTLQEADDDWRKTNPRLIGETSSATFASSMK
jgi:hypothetical protein